MGVGNLVARLVGRFQRGMADSFFRRPVRMHNSAPVISFTFDDFPRSALTMGGGILQRYGLVGTYYAALSLMGKSSPCGEVFVADDLKPLLQQGHELGCHTFHHCHAWSTAPRVFEASIAANQRAVERILTGFGFRSLSYPIGWPRPHTKRRAARHFAACRGGGQMFNVGVADLNNLRAFFIERSWGDFASIKNIIDQNREARGWLILATHDVSDSPTQYGCTPEYFERTVKYSLASGASILTVADACEAIMRPQPLGELENARPSVRAFAGSP